MGSNGGGVIDNEMANGVARVQVDYIYIASVEERSCGCPDGTMNGIVVAFSFDRHFTLFFFNFCITFCVTYSSIVLGICPFSSFRVSAFPFAFLCLFHFRLVIFVLSYCSLLSLSRLASFFLHIISFYFVCLPYVLFCPFCFFCLQLVVCIRCFISAIMEFVLLYLSGGNRYRPDIGWTGWLSQSRRVDLQ